MHYERIALDSMVACEAQARPSPSPESAQADHWLPAFPVLRDLWTRCPVPGHRPFGRIIRHIPIGRLECRTFCYLITLPLDLHRLLRTSSHISATVLLPSRSSERLGADMPPLDWLERRVASRRTDFSELAQKTFGRSIPYCSVRRRQRYDWGCNI